MFIQYIAYYLRWKTFTCFTDYFTTAKFVDEFLHMNAMKACKAGNHKNILKNEGNNMKQQKFFTTNNKQYMVHAFV